MKIIKLLALTLILFSLSNCKKDEYDDYTYEFLNSYCTRVNTGGVVGLIEKCYASGDQVNGSKVQDGVVTIRIAKHSKAKGKPETMTLQEIMDVPFINLKIIHKN